MRMHDLHMNKLNFANSTESAFEFIVTLDFLFIFIDILFSRNRDKKDLLWYEEIFEYWLLIFKSFIADQKNLHCKKMQFLIAYIRDN